jgi:hypothetical protein
MEPLNRVTSATVDVLRVLVDANGLCWGLQVIKSSARPAGSVYPILERLETLGWLRSSWDFDDSRSGPRRRYYELTEGGVESAAAALRDFDTRNARTIRTPGFITPRVVNA